AGNVRIAAWCYLGLGAAARYGHPEASFAAYRKAWKFANLAGDKKCIATCIRRRGVLALDRHQYALAHRRFREALAIFERIHDKAEVANCIWRIGEVWVQRLEYEGNFGRVSRQQVEGTLLQALRLNRPIKSLDTIANCRFDLGEIAFNNAQYN